VPDVVRTAATRERRSRLEPNRSRQPRWCGPRRECRRADGGLGVEASYPFYGTLFPEQTAYRTRCWRAEARSSGWLLTQLGVGISRIRSAAVRSPFAA
jgi:hypothetical protein